MTSGPDLQLAIMETRVNDKVNPLTIDEIRDDLYLHFERLNMKAKEEIESFVHCGFETFRSTTKIHNLTTFRNAKFCKDCAIAKAEQK
jgi:hypothetical protein